MYKFKKVISILLLASVFCSFVACGNKNTEEETGNDTANATQQTTTSNFPERELKQSDYRGATIRTMAMREAVLNKMDEMKSENAKIREEYPNTFWTQKGYQEFVVDFMNASIINDTQWFNEEEATWDETVSQIVSVENNFTTLSDGAYVAKYPNMKIIRYEKDDYAITGVSGDVDGFNFSWSTTGLTKESVKFSGDYTWRMLYDSDKDWLKAYCDLTLNQDKEFLPAMTIQMFEYVRIDDDTYAIQTGRERLFIVLEPVEKDTLLSERKIKEFYYSKLVSEGARSSFESFVPKPEYNEVTGEADMNAARYNETMKRYSFYNDKGDIANLYGKNDSIFKHSDIAADITRDWVFEDASLQQAIVYKDNCLVVTTYNKITEKYEQFIYAYNDVTDSLKNELKGLVDLDRLVGIIDVPDVEFDALCNDVVRAKLEEMGIAGLEEMQQHGFTFDAEGNVVQGGRIIISKTGEEMPSEAATEAAPESSDSDSGSESAADSSGVVSSEEVEATSETVAETSAAETSGTAQ